MCEGSDTFWNGKRVLVDDQAAPDMVSLWGCRPAEGDRGVDASFARTIAP